MINGQDKLTEEWREILGKIIKKAMLIQEHRIMKRTAYSRPIVPRKHGKDRKFITKRMISQSRGLKHERSRGRADGDDMEVYGQHSAKKLRTRSRSRSQ
jgi:hypothetical protein